MNADNATIEHVTDVPLTSAEEIDRSGVHTSFSRLSEILRCEWKYMMKYELHLKAPPNLKMIRGKAGHAALEANARHKIINGTDMDVAQIHSVFSDTFDRELLEAGDEAINPGDDPGSAKDATYQNLTYYRLKHAPTIEPIAVELEFLAPFPATEENHEPIPPIKGFIDTIQRRARKVMPNARPVKRVELLDRKFPQRRPSDAQDRAILSPQLTMYDMVLTAAGKPPDDIGFENHIPPTKTKGADTDFVYRPPEFMTPEARETRHARLMLMLRRMYRAIRHGDLYKPVDDPRLCRDCEFRRRCQFSLAKDDYVYERLTADKFQI